MKGHRLLIKILSYLAIILAFIMVTLNIFPSWSQFARTLYEPLLFATLSAISSTFLIRSFTHPEERRVLFKIGKMNLRLGHINRLAGFLFIGVLCTPVTHPNKYIVTAHFILTGLALLATYLQLVFYYRIKVDKTKFWAAMIGTVLGIGGFLGAFVFNLYPVGLGEFIAAIPILLLVLDTNRE